MAARKYFSEPIVLLCKDFDSIELGTEYDHFSFK
jgi:hypothetical protein